MKASRTPFASPKWYGPFWKMNIEPPNATICKPPRKFWEPVWNIYLFSPGPSLLWLNRWPSLLQFPSQNCFGLWGWTKNAFLEETCHGTSFFSARRREVLLHRCGAGRKFLQERIVVKVHRKTQTKHRESFLKLFSFSMFFWTCLNWFWVVASSCHYCHCVCQLVKPPYFGQNSYLLNHHKKGTRLPPLGACSNEILGCRLFRSAQFDDFSAEFFIVWHLILFQNWVKKTLVDQAKSGARRQDLRGMFMGIFPGMIFSVFVLWFDVML